MKDHGVPVRLDRGDPVPHFEITDIEAGHVSYCGIWQQRHLLLVCLGRTAVGSYGDSDYVGGVRALAGSDVACVVTRDEVAGVPSPGVLVADRWGEVAEVVSAEGGRWPSQDDLAATLLFLRTKCPECEGEAR